MSNPAVIFLSQTTTITGESFRVEDNIGESIHIHYGNLRLDLTIGELLKLGEFLTNVVNEIIEIDEFEMKSYDPGFLKHLGGSLLGLEKISYERIKTSDLKVFRTNFVGLPILSLLHKSMMYRALNGDSKEYDVYKQENEILISNSERLSSLESFMKDFDYPFNNEYIVLVNNQNIIRDGQHRASILMNNNIDEIEIVRLHFKDNRNNLNTRPYLQVLFYWDLRKVKNVVKFFVRLYKKIKRRIVLKIISLNEK